MNGTAVSRTNCSNEPVKYQQAQKFLGKKHVLIKLVKSLAYSLQGSHTDQLDFCNWLADGSI